MESGVFEWNYHRDKKITEKKDSVMQTLLVSKILQGFLFIIAFITYIIADIQEKMPESISMFEEAAKYGFAVLVLFIVLALLYKDWQKEKKYSKDEIQKLNSLIVQMVETNRTALERSAQAMENQNEATKRMTELIQDLRSEVKSN